MNLEEIKRKYPNEWVLVEFDRLEQDLEIKEGHVLAHASSKEEIYKALSRSSGKNLSVEYMGSVPSDVAVMFFVQ